MAEDHEDGPIHQAPWVVPTTIAIVLGFVLVMMLLRYFVGAGLGT